MKIPTKSEARRLLIQMQKKRYGAYIITRLIESGDLWIDGRIPHVFVNSAEWWHLVHACGTSAKTASGQRKAVKKFFNEILREALDALEKSGRTSENR